MTSGSFETGSGDDSSVDETTVEVTFEETTEVAEICEYNLSTVVVRFFFRPKISTFD